MDEFLIVLLKVNRSKRNGAWRARSFIKNKWSSNIRGDEIVLPSLWNAKPQPFPLRLGFLLSLFLVQSSFFSLLSAQALLRVVLS